MAPQQGRLCVMRLEGEKAWGGCHFNSAKNWKREKLRRRDAKGKKRRKWVWGGEKTLNAQNCNKGGRELG